MRFIHTADWHLGRIFHGVHLTQDQAQVLDRLVEFCREARPDALFVAGDVFDRAVPPPEAVSLLDDVLTRIVAGLGIAVVLIAGNHDSPDRLEFGSRLLSGRGLHVAGSRGIGAAPLVFADAHGPVHVHALPYAEPAVVRERLGDGSARDHDAAMRAMVGRCAAGRGDGARSVLLAHAFVLGGEESESERPLSVGGAGAVGADCFAGFGYVALGHLHRPQSAGDGRIRYAGSLMKYSFAEAGHAKSVDLVEIDAQGNCTVEAVPLGAPRDVRRIEGTLSEVLSGAGRDPSPDDYLLVSLLDREPVLDPAGKLRQVYPNLLHVERPLLAGPGEVDGPGRALRRMGDAELFGAFFAQVTGDAMTPEQEKAFGSVVQDLWRREREAGP